MKRKTLLCLQQQIAHGDEQAFEALMHETMPVLHAYAYRVLHDQQLAEEVVMDVYVKLWQRRHVFGEVNNPIFYLLKAVKNTALNYLKSSSREAISAEPEMSENDFALRITPEDALISKEHIRQIQQALDELPPRSRQVLLLCKEYRLSYAEVAELLGISQATVNVHMTQALKKLWKTLEALHLVSS
ncbi:RNA polymerase sigma-70 factor (ECF subfamily) [Thermoflavifilum aggregans]|uniref:RNA polymerase sigma-70 factor (ECF subfamily) n=1 Tax=Thermoflavifilum aggregans TaxID=454188 RepID=A0A2M9CVV5_9BACT|nr:RNA polymerase sigma-70 factor [Thermoflavifilum aggregans]PJJ76052.1 RNA polymerase sigma-70 factor (ECF subfamily) [Thermoflavifilum aggregans]